MVEKIKIIYRFLQLLLRLNISRTIYINFKTQNFSTAIKFPIFVYGKLKIYSLRGSLIIDAPIETGMIKIGYRWIDLFPSSYVPSQLHIIGKLVFKGKVLISGGVGLFIQKPSAILSIGNFCTIGSGSIIKSMDHLIIGDNSQITMNCVLMNSNMHYVKNIDSGEISKPYGSIIIGENCWINYGTIVTKGAIIPDYCISARNSFLSKDYSKYGTNLFLVGSPASPKGGKIQRIFDSDKEVELSRLFANNPEIEFYNDEKGFYPDTNENNSLFKAF